MSKALETQVGGDHYKKMAIQPVEFAHKNGLGYCEAAIVKYVCRYKHKNGRQDLEKAKHFIELLIELEYGHDKQNDLNATKCMRCGGGKVAGSDTCLQCTHRSVAMMMNMLNANAGEGKPA